MAPDGKLFAVCASQPAAGQQIKAVLASSDGGVHWRRAYLCDEFTTPIPACSSHAVLNSGYLGGLGAMSSRTLVLVGPRSPLLVSNDGGSRWRVAIPYAGGGGESAQVVVFSSRRAVGLVGQLESGIFVGTLCHTVDGGVRWTCVVPRLG